MKDHASCIWRTPLCERMRIQGNEIYLVRTQNVGIGGQEEHVFCEMMVSIGHEENEKAYEWTM
jgi:hypothetical protein